MTHMRQYVETHPPYAPTSERGWFICQNPRCEPLGGVSTSRFHQLTIDGRCQYCQAPVADVHVVSRAEEIIADTYRMSDELRAEVEAAQAKLIERRIQVYGHEGRGTSRFGLMVKEQAHQTQTTELDGCDCQDCLNAAYGEFYSGGS